MSDKPTEPVEVRAMRLHADGVSQLEMNAIHGIVLGVLMEKASRSDMGGFIYGTKEEIIMGLAPHLRSAGANKLIPELCEKIERLEKELTTHDEYWVSEDTAIDMVKVTEDPRMSNMVKVQRLYAFLTDSELDSSYLLEEEPPRGSP